jgi:predicted dehydrogenase
MRLLIAGLGSIGRRHLRNLLALGERDLVLLRTGKSTLPDDDLTSFPCETDLRIALERYRPQAVIVSNPTANHLDVAIPAARAGCAVLLEKPPSHSMERLDELAEAAGQGRARILVGFQFRFHPHLVRAREFIVAGQLGKILSAHVHFGEYLPGWHPWEDYRQSYAARTDLGGGVVLTQCHALDYLPWLVGGVASVWAFTGRLAEFQLEVEDTAEIGLRFASGALGSLHLDFTQKPAVHELALVGSRGTLRADLLGKSMWLHQHDEATPRSYAVPDAWERNAMFMEEMRHFLLVARGEAAPSCTLEEGVHVQQLISAVRDSARLGRVSELNP